MRHPLVLMIVGTDTGVGKTWVGCALAREFRRKGRPVVAIKPLETGCGKTIGASEDGVALAHATGQRAPAHALMRFRDPVAPPEAASRERRRIDFAALMRRIRGYASQAEVTLVEGAGGLLSPLTWKHDALDIARALRARVLLVASDRLGTINHTLMTLRLLRSSRLGLVGLVLTEPEKADASTGSNAGAIARLSGLSRILCAPRTHDLDIIPSQFPLVARWCERATW